MATHKSCVNVEVHGYNLLVFLSSCPIEANVPKEEQMSQMCLEDVAQRQTDLKERTQTK
jgi:hypothetical protein